MPFVICLRMFLASVMFQCIPLLAVAQVEQESTVSVTELATGLQNPTSVAYSAGSKFVFVCESDAARILAFAADADSATAAKQSVVVEGLSNGAAKPISIALLNATTLAVGSGSVAKSNEGPTKPNGQLVVFDINSTWPQTAKDSVTEIGIPASTSSPKLDQFNCLAVGSEYVYWTTTGDPKQWLAKAEYSDKGIKANTEQRWLSVADTVQGEMTVSSLTVSPDGYLLMGLVDSSSKSSAIHFIDVKSKAIRASFAIEQPGLQAMAYSPRSKRLFAIFHSADQPDMDGLYKLVARKRNTACEARLVTRIPRPKSLAFLANGKLLVTTNGAEGKVLLVDGLDPAPIKNESKETGK